MVMVRVMITYTSLHGILIGTEKHILLSSKHNAGESCTIHATDDGLYFLRLGTNALIGTNSSILMVDTATSNAGDGHNVSIPSVPAVSHYEGKM